MATKAWESLCRKIAKYNEKYRSMNLVCFGVLGDTVQVTGTSELRVNFGLKAAVQATYKEAVLDHSVVTEETAPSGEGSVNDYLKTHVFDLNVDMMRSILSIAAGPPNSHTNKSGRRNWYQDINCPSWWSNTGISFHSVNQRGPDGRKLNTESLMMLIESLQQHHGIVPSPPQCRNKTKYLSVFTATYVEEREHFGAEHDDHEMDSAAEDEEMMEETCETVVDHTDVAAGQAEAVVEGKDVVDNMDESKEDVDNMDGVEEIVGDRYDVTGGIHQARQEIDRLGYLDISWEERSLKIMKQITSWDRLWGLSDAIISKLPKIECKLSTTWSMKPLLETDQRFKEFIPLTIGERTVLSATPNGNCIYNAVSTAIYGTENMAMTLRLSSVVKMVEDVVPFAKYILEEFRELTHLWLSTATHSQKTISQNVTAEEIEMLLREELLGTVQFPYRDGTILHLHILSHLLSRPIQQHCVKGDNFKQYKQLLHPPLHDVKCPSPLHLVWVPTVPKSKYASINHVVPAVCHCGPYGAHAEECAFGGMSACALTYGFNPHLTRPYWVECCMCGQWLHTVCLGIDDKEYASREFPCGCDILRDGKCPVRSFEFYENLTVERLPEGIDLKRITENIPDSLRNSLFRSSGHSRLKWELRTRFGPFQDEFVDSLNIKLKEYVREEDWRLVPDIYLPEVLLRIIMIQEDVNRLLAEMVLMKKF